MKKLILFLLFPILLFSKTFALVTVSIGSTYYEATLPGIISKEEYCNLHGYDFICFRESIDPSRPHAWQKIKALQKTLKNYDWVFWSDADSIIMNNKILLEDLVDENSSFIICYDNISHVVNSGQFLIKNSKESIEFLDFVYSKREFTNHPWWENAAIIDALKDNKFSPPFVKMLPQRVMNSFSFEVSRNHPAACFQEGDFIIHFPSIHNISTLKMLMSFYFNKIERAN